ncbi:hypothetical protein Pcinc_037627 [Petrolisthes cinctipes]|uniref:Potassium voltage-gated channel subfamily KQT member 1 n=1 Tax=Petrolisthes cinctipes TaxID=88211 RepID=A0AAE1BT51_PETCI|nr:hypothetical protein Pcinc_037627 [Petrolisthes cinctipes]
MWCKFGDGVVLLWCECGEGVVLLWCKCGDAVVLLWCECDDGGVVSSVMDARSLWEARYVMKERKTNKTTFQGRVYNFLERPTGWKCFLYHFSV